MAGEEEEEEMTIKKQPTPHKMSNSCINLDLIIDIVHLHMTL